MELHALKEELLKIEASGASLVAIAPEMPDKVAETTARHDLQFEVLNDQGNRGSRQFGLVFSLPESLHTYAGVGIDLPAYNGGERFELRLPSTDVIQPDGQIVYGFVDTDYTRRMEPSYILDALRLLCSGLRVYSRGRRQIWINPNEIESSYFV